MSKNKHTPAYIAEQAVTIFLNSEVGDYSHFENWQITNVSDYDGDTLILDVDWVDRQKGVQFKIDTSQITLDGDDDYTGKIEVCMYEDVYEEVATYDWTVKYFWQTFLRWD